MKVFFNVAALHVPLAVEREMDNIPRKGDQVSFDDGNSEREVLEVLWIWDLAEESRFGTDEATVYVVLEPTVEDLRPSRSESMPEPRVQRYEHS